MSRSKEFIVSAAGHTGYVPPRRDQSQRVYDGEWLWRHNYNPAGKTISPQGAKDLMGEIIHHKSLNNFPDIHHLRNPEMWNPESHVNFDELQPGQGQAYTESTGHVNYDPRKLDVGTVTHETAHLSHMLGNQFYDTEGTPGGFEHEWPFAASHLHIVHNTMGREASIPLKNAYRMWGAQWQPKHRVQE
jgi:hypothetical protein